MSRQVNMRSCLLTFASIALKLATFQLSTRLAEPSKAGGLIEALYVASTAPHAGILSLANSHVKLPQIQLMIHVWYRGVKVRGVLIGIFHTWCCWYFLSSSLFCWSLFCFTAVTLRDGWPYKEGMPDRAKEPLC